MKFAIYSIATAALIVSGVLGTAFAGAADYEFKPVSVDVRDASTSEFAVRLIHKPSGKPVEQAVIFRTRLDMSPDGMADMTAAHKALPASEPGVYRFTGDFNMAGKWAFKLMAKVPGEEETVEGTVVFNAKD